MNYRYIGFLRIAEWLHCGVIYGHKANDKPELMTDQDGQQVWVDTCSRCGAQKAIAPHKPEQLIQISS
jgi:hypothetical protein